MILKGGNRPKLDKDGYVEAFVVLCEDADEINRKTGEEYKCLKWWFSYEGLQRKAVNVWKAEKDPEKYHHVLQTQFDLNPANEEGVYNALSNLCKRLGLVTDEELQDPDVGVDTDKAIGLRVRYMMRRNDEKQYIMDADTITLVPEKAKDKR